MRDKLALSRSFYAAGSPPQSRRRRLAHYYCRQRPQDRPPPAAAPRPCWPWWSMPPTFRACPVPRHADRDDPKLVPPAMADNPGRPTPTRGHPARTNGTTGNHVLLGI